MLNKTAFALENSSQNITVSADSVGKAFGGNLHSMPNVIYNKLCVVILSLTAAESEKILTCCRFWHIISITTFRQQLKMHDASLPKCFLFKKSSRDTECVTWPQLILRKGLFPNFLELKVVRLSNAREKQFTGYLRRTFLGKTKSSCIQYLELAKRQTDRKWSQQNIAGLKPNLHVFLAK